MVDIDYTSLNIAQKLGSGAFGDIYLGLIPNSNQEVAVKFENASNNTTLLLSEAKIYRYLLKDSAANDNGIPQVYHCSTEGDYNIMIMELLGNSLEDLFNLCNRKFSLKTVLSLGEMMLSRIEYLHSHHIVHRDIKPENFVFGRGRNQDKLYMIDFGLSKRFVGRNHVHIPYSESKGVTGTSSYSSVNVLQGIEYSRRDDLESLCYVLLYFLRGGLPWQNINTNDIKKKCQLIKEQKLATPIEVLCADYPAEIMTFMLYCRNLKFEERPDYNYLKGLLNKLYTKLGYENDNNYDWSSLDSELLNKKQK